MAVGASVKKAFDKVGIPYTIKRSGEADITGERCIYDINKLASRPFLREFVLPADLAYDTEVINGDIIEFVDDSRRFLIASKIPDMYGSDVILYDSILFKCNVTNGQILRASGESEWPEQTYHKDTSWEVINAGVNALIIESFTGNKLEREPIGDLSTEKLELYLPSSFDLRVLDRFQTVSGEYYKVEVLKSHVHSGITIAEVSEDTR